MLGFECELEYVLVYLVADYYYNMEETCQLICLFFLPLFVFNMYSELIAPPMPTGSG